MTGKQEGTGLLPTRRDVVADHDTVLQMKYAKTGTTNAQLLDRNGRVERSGADGAAYLIGKVCRLLKDLHKHFASQLARLRVLIGRVVAGQQSLAIW